MKFTVFQGLFIALLYYLQCCGVIKCECSQMHYGVLVKDPQPFFIPKHQKNSLLSAVLLVICVVYLTKDASE